MKSGWFSTFFSLLLLLHTFCLVTCQKKLKQRQSEKIQNEEEEDDDDEEEKMKKKWARQHTAESAIMWTLP